MRTQTTLKSALLVGLSCASFAAVSFGIRALLGPPSGDEAAAKLAYLEDHIADYDTFFVGSSVVFRHVVPAVFDARRAELGRPARSFNLGSPGMEGLEADHTLRGLLELLPSDSTATVYFEPTEPKALLIAGQETTERSVAWHDVEATRLALELIPSGELGPRASAELAGHHLRAFLWNRTNYAQGERILRRMLPALFPHQPGGLDSETIASGAGYQALEDSADPAVITRGAAFAAGDGGALAASVAELRAARHRQATARSGDDVRERILRKRQAAAEAARAELVWLVPPTLRPMPFVRRAAAFAPPLFEYNAPGRYPMYFKSASHFDRNHLTRAASEAFSRRLAEDTAL